MSPSHLQEEAYGPRCLGDSGIRAGPWWPVPHKRHEGCVHAESVHTVHMKRDLARLQRRVAYVLVTDFAKLFDVIAQDVHLIAGARVGLGDGGHVATHTEGFSHTLPLGLWQSESFARLPGTPQGTIQGCMPARRRPSPS